MTAVVHPISEDPQQADELEHLRTHLPLDDPDRHALDTIADAVFVRFAYGPKGGAE